MEKKKYSFKNFKKNIGKIQKWNEKRELKSIKNQKRRLEIDKQKAAIATEQAKIYNAKLKAAKAREKYNKTTDPLAGFANFGMEQPKKRKKKNNDFFDW